MPRKKSEMAMAGGGVIDIEGRYDEERARRWLDQLSEEDYTPLTWTAEYVAERLVEAYGIAYRMPGYVGPKMPQTAWRKDVVHLRTEQEQIEIDNFNADEKLVSKPARPTVLEIARMEQAIAWPSAYLSDDADMASCVAWCAEWRCEGLDVDRMAARFYVAGSLTFHVKQKEGFQRIAAALNKEGVAVS